MVVPVNGEKDKAQDITKEFGDQRDKCCKITFVWRLQLKHLDRNDDGKHAIAKNFESSFAHCYTPVRLTQQETREISEPFSSKLIDNFIWCVELYPSK